MQMFCTNFPFYFLKFYNINQTNLFEISWNEKNVKQLITI
jgi:hypothetical protein